MIINQSQLEIANKSYTNKDFADIYTELLAYAEKLSTRFSPISANETDPFIIMLKLLAFVGDKINYNIDKNILERFMLSCTQETSMRELTNMLGYYMHFFRSASTEVVFKIDNISRDFSIPKYSILNAANDIQYITLNDTIIDKKTKQSLPVLAIQGKLKTLSILGSDKIQLENIDSSNRLYFPEYYVAENGVFISSDVASEEWTRVENLNEEQYLDTVFYFGYDSYKRLPYIQFPEWISRIIGSGLSIKYIVTDGYNGNIAPKSFNSVIISESALNTIEGEEKVDTSLIIPINMSAASNGADPETLEASYTGFKKIVGTVDTLVTCRDYANKIYDMLDKYGNNIVSNVIVSDRRIDLNNSTQLYTVGDFGKYFKTTIANNESGSDITVPSMTAHDLCIYAYNPLTNHDWINYDAPGGYKDSYNIIGTHGEKSGKHYQIEQYLESSKSISHQYKALTQDDIVAIHMYIKVDAIITTKTKVSAVEGQQIIYNIKNALLRDYNSRTITPGYEIPFDSIYKTIIEADSRIKNVSLQEPSTEAKIITFNPNHNTKLPSQSDLLSFIVLKNIASGRISAFDYDERFEYLYDYEDCNIYENVNKITTNANIWLKRPNENSNYVNYVLNKNEAIQFIAPKFNTFVKYPYGILYHLVLKAGKTFIPKDSDYKLEEGEYLIFAYADSNSNWTADLYSGSTSDSEAITVINPNFDMYTTAKRVNEGESVDKKLPTDKLGVSYPNIDNEVIFYMLSTNDEVRCKKPMEDIIESSIYCYWITNNKSNAINWTSTHTIDDDSVERDSNSYNCNVDIYYEYILSDDEYFYYTDLASTVLFEYGSGTKLTYFENVNINIAINTTDTDDIIADKIANKINSYYRENLINLWSHNIAVNVEDVIENGLSALSGKFIFKNFNETNSLGIYINEIKTLSEGDSLMFKFESTAPESIRIPNNTFTFVDSLNSDSDIHIQNIQYIYDSYEIEGLENTEDSIQVLPNRSNLGDNYNWKVRGLLDLNCGPDQAQHLVTPQKEGEIGQQIILFINEDDKEKSITITPTITPTSFRSNININKNGGENILLSYLDIENNLNTAHPSFLVYTLDNNTHTFLKSESEDFYKLNLFINEEIDAEYDYILNDNNKIDFTTYISGIDTTSIDIDNSIKFHLPPFTEAQMLGITVVLPSDYNEDDVKVSVEVEGNNLDISTLKNYSSGSSDTSSSSNTTSCDLSAGINNLLIYSNSDNESNDGESSSDYQSVDSESNNERYMIFKLSTELDPKYKGALYTSSIIPCKLGKIKLINNVNSCIDTDDSLSTYITNKLADSDNNTIYKKIPDFDKCYIFGDLDLAKKIDLNRGYKMNSAQAFYNSNNVANNWVMPIIDFENSNISIASSSMK